MFSLFVLVTVPPPKYLNYLDPCVEPDFDQDILKYLERKFWDSLSILRDDDDIE